MLKPKTHEIAVIMDGGEIEILKFGDEEVELKPLKGRQVQEYIRIATSVLQESVLMMLEKKIKLTDVFDEVEIKSLGGLSRPFTEESLVKYRKNIESGGKVSGADLESANVFLGLLISKVAMEENLNLQISKFVCKLIGKDLDWWKEHIIPNETSNIFFEIIGDQNNMHEFLPFYLQKELGKVMTNLAKKKGSMIGQTTKT